MFNLQKYKEKESVTRLRDATTFLYQRAFIGITLKLISITVFTFVIAHEIPLSEKVNYWIIMLCIMCVRILDVGYWFAYLRKNDYAPLWVSIRFSFGVLITASLWSIFIILLFNQFEPITIASALIISCGMSTGAISAISSSRALTVIYTTILMIPISVAAINSTHSEFLALGCIGIFYWVAMLLISFKNNEILLQTSELGYANLCLKADIKKAQENNKEVKQQLQHATEALDHANTSLELEVNKRTEDIHRLSNRDPLTGLMNRKGFMRLLNKQISVAEQLDNRFALLFIDLDGFKQINDSLGHQVGDGVLEEIAKRLARYSDLEHLGRWGGDEFVMLIPYANGDTAIAVAHATRSSIALPMEVMSYQVSLDATIGISLYPDHSKDSQGLIQLADLTMYELKKTKPGTFALFNESLYIKLQKDLTYRDGLRNALENNEFSLVYQPLVNAGDYNTWGFEALLRWDFNQQAVPPSEFIPLAEKIGLIIDIGSWVLHRACIDASQWSDKEHTVSVNVSVIQVMDDGFIDTLDKVIASSGLAPHRLHLEITESVFADNKERVKRQIFAIKQRQIQISIDDFGTGYSSLSQLQSLSFDHIKIDRSFVQDLEEGSDTIIRATLLMAKEFSCLTVAEGIETSEHADRLHSMGVNLFQGYYFAKPMPNNAISNWLIEHQQKYH